METLQETATSIGKVVVRSGMAERENANHPRIPHSFLSESEKLCSAKWGNIKQLVKCYANPSIDSSSYLQSAVPRNWEQKVREELVIHLPTKVKQQEPNTWTLIVIILPANPGSGTMGYTPISLRASPIG